MHTGFIMLPQMISSPNTALIVFEDKKLPMVVNNSSKALVKV